MSLQLVCFDCATGRGDVSELATWKDGLCCICGEYLRTKRAMLAPTPGVPNTEMDRLKLANAELLACLKDLLDNAEIDALNEPELEPRCEAARAAIARATGGG